MKASCWSCQRYFPRPAAKRFDRLGQLYELWYQDKDFIQSTYTEEPTERVPLSQNEEFKPIRNAVIREALNISGKVIPNEEEPEPDLTQESYDDFLLEQSSQADVKRLIGMSHSKNPAVALAAFRLLLYLTRLIQNKIEDERRSREGIVDKKLRRKIDAKREAHGLKHG